MFELDRVILGLLFQYFDPTPLIVVLAIGPFPLMQTVLLNYLGLYLFLAEFSGDGDLFLGFLFLFDFADLIIVLLYFLALLIFLNSFHPFSVFFSFFSFDFLLKLFFLFLFSSLSFLLFYFCEFFLFLLQQILVIHFFPLFFLLQFFLPFLLLLDNVFFSGF